MVFFDHFFGPCHTQKTFFASINQYFNDKLSLFLAEVTFDVSEENQLSYFQKGYFLKKSLNMFVMFMFSLLRLYNELLM